MFNSWGGLTIFARYDTLILIFQYERPSFDKPSETKRFEREHFKPEERMVWLEPRGAWQEVEHNNQHKTEANKATELS